MAKYALRSVPTAIWVIYRWMLVRSQLLVADVQGQLGSFHVQKVDSFGQSSTYPATYSQGTCVSDVLIDPSYDDFTLYAVINDGTYEHTTGMIQISGLDASGYNFEELWNQ